MSAEANLIVALVITVGSSLGLVRLLWRYLDPVLADYCGNSQRGRVWALLCAALIICLPLFALTLDLRPAEPLPSWLFHVMAHLRWPLMALVLATLIVSGIVLAVHIPRDVPLSRADIDDLKRLLDKVQEVRAREILSRSSDPPTVHAKELDELNRLVDKIQSVRTRDPHGHGAGPHSVN